MKTITTCAAGVLILAGSMTAQQRFDALKAKDLQTGFSGNAEQFNQLMEVIVLTNLYFRFLDHQNIFG